MLLTGDFVIVGSGIAGLRAAIDLAARGDVLMLTKAGPNEGSTGFAQGGIAAALGPDDSPALHASDTLAAGDGLCDERAVSVLVEEGPRYVRELVDWGADFDRDPQGRLELAREGAHSTRRVVHARDATGRAIERTLWSRLAGRARVLPHALATRLVLRDGVCVGVRFLLADGTEGAAYGRATLVATGGSGRIYRETTNPVVATGDGVAMAYRAGARVGDMEFVQFHPTALDVAGEPRFLISEALRGEGARLVNQSGEAFMTRYHVAAELAPRDVVSRAIATEAERTAGPVSLLLSHLDPAFVRLRFPSIAEVCARAGLDLATDPIPVSPAAHYMMGGIETDLDGRTSIPGLFAAGEAACTGVHGANRLASNSLLEGLVFGARAGQAMGREPAGGAPLEPLEAGGRERRAPGPWAAPDRVREQAGRLQAVLWEQVGLFRVRAGLEQALGELDGTWNDLGPALDEGRAGDPEAWRLGSIALAGRLVARAALRREESRGAHFRSDFPARDDLHWKRHVADARSPGAANPSTHTGPRPEE